jgi:hypothetical protein
MRGLTQNIDPSMDELGERMRPGALSERGFLGPNETLASVLIRDSQTVDRLGLSHKELAGFLKRVLRNALDRREELLRADYAQ